MPPTPSAASIESAPVGITLTGTSTSRFPRRIMAPLPCCFSICEIAASNIFAFSSVMIHLERKGACCFRGGARLHCGVYYKAFWPAQVHRGGQDTIRRRKSKRYFTSANSGLGFFQDRETLLVTREIS